MRVLKMMKRGKAPCPDGILNEMFNYGGSMQDGGKYEVHVQCNEEKPKWRCADQIMILRGACALRKRRYLAHGFNGCDLRYSVEENEGICSLDRSPALDF